MPVVVKAKDPVGLGGIHHIQSLAPEIGSEFDRVPAAHHGERVEKLGDRCREVASSRPLSGRSAGSPATVKIGSTDAKEFAGKPGTVIPPF